MAFSKRCRHLAIKNWELYKNMKYLRLSSLLSQFRLSAKQKKRKRNLHYNRLRSEELLKLNTECQLNASTANLIEVKTVATIKKIQDKLKFKI